MKAPQSFWSAIAKTKWEEVIFKFSCRILAEKQTKLQLFCFKLQLFRFKMFYSSGALRGEACARFPAEQIAPENS